MARFDLPVFDESVSTDNPTGSALTLVTLTIAGALAVAVGFASRDAGQALYNRVTSYAGVSTENSEDGVMF